jgi:flagellar hook assembly protein FlgD
MANQTTTVNFILVGVDNEDETLPVVATALNGNYPNPFNPETTISFAVKEAAAVKLDIYNLKGQLIRSLVHEDKAPGHYRVVWNGKDNQGFSVGSGVYFYRMTAGSYSSTKKMLLME